MASKRSRATFEADLQAQQSPYVRYGTPLPPLDPEVRDDGSYVPMWKQEVTDERGRKRLHGAFTGGFSAGYFNTVGSKEGWTPSTFVSSRSNRNKDGAIPRQKAEDFMDEEDLADAEEARKLQTADLFAGFGSGSDAQEPVDTFEGLFRMIGETMGVKLLKKMGWREGQGIGPKVRRTANPEDGQQAGLGDTHLFAPANSPIISFLRKTDRKGLGFEAEQVLAGSRHVGADTGRNGVLEDAEERPMSSSLTNGDKPKNRKAGPRGGFGMGILNDTGSDEEDAYAMGPAISYNRVIGGDKKKKRKAEVPAKSAANPLLNSKPVFIPKKATAAKGNPGFRRCHDGRLPIEGFTLSFASDTLASILSQDTRYPLISIPNGWKSSKTTATESPNTQAEHATPTKLNASSRAALLGEQPLPFKSVFDFLTPAARSRIAVATSNSNLPPALSVAATVPTPPLERGILPFIPNLPKDTALAALGRGTSGWLPYADNPSKRSRYVSFLEQAAGLRGDEILPGRARGMRDEDWIKELEEFAHAATIFKPMSGAMASRFTSSSSSGPKKEDASVAGQRDGKEGKERLLRQAKVKTPAEEAAAAGMYGHLTRSVENWYPTRLLCKRFNVPPPTHVQVGPGEEPGGGHAVPARSTALPQKQLELVGKRDMDELRVGGAGGAGTRSVGFISGGVERGSGGEVEEKQEEGRSVAVAINPERNEAIEKERPGEAVFKAIFGSDSEDN